MDVLYSIWISFSSLIILKFSEDNIAGRLMIRPARIFSFCSDIHAALFPIKRQSPSLAVVLDHDRLS